MAKYIVIVLSIFLTSCEEYFVPDINKQVKSLIFEGFITDQPDDLFVKIVQSNAYNDDTKYTSVSDFTVLIEDENGLKYPLVEVQPGYYKSDSTAIVAQSGYVNSVTNGSIGVKYRMVAKSPEGKIFHSKWEELVSSAPIDSLFGAYDEALMLTYENGSGYRELLVPGVNILNNLNAVGQAQFYRYEFDIVYQSLNYYDAAMLQFYVARPESSMTFDYISILNANLYNKNDVLENIVHFLPLHRLDHRVVIDSMEYDYLGRPLYHESQIVFTQKGFLIQIKQYSLSQKGFQFWDAIYKQGASSGEVFDPVETQIEGNIINVSDSTELVFGYFGASAVTKKAVFMNPVREGIFIKPVKYFPILTAPIASLNSFDFWVNEFAEL